MKGNKTLIRKVFQPTANLQSFFSFVLVSLVFLIVPLGSVSCQSPVSRMSDEQALQAIRQLTKDGKLPPESIVAVFKPDSRAQKLGQSAGVRARKTRVEIGDD